MFYKKKYTAISRKYKILLTIFLILFLLPTLLYTILRSSGVQTYITHKLCAYVKDEYGLTIAVKGVDIAFFSSVIIEGIYAEDYRHDTLLYVSDLRVKIDKIQRVKHKLHAKKITIDNLVVKMFTDSTGTSNLDRFLAALDSGDTPADTTTEGKPWRVYCKNIELRNAAFVMANQIPDTVPFGLNFTDMDVRNINLSIDNLQLEDTIQVDVRHLSLADKSGFAVTDLTTHLRYADTGILLDSMNLQLPQSRLCCDYLYFNYDSISAFSDFLAAVDIKTNICDTSYIYTEDLAYFVPDIHLMNQRIGIGGKLSGTVSNLSGRNFHLAIGERTYIDAKFDITGLPNFKETYLFLDITDLQASPADIAQIKLPPYDASSYIPVPVGMLKLGVFHYKANFFGLLTDFASKGTLSSPLGTITTDIHIAPDKTNKDSIAFGGKIQTFAFDLGPLIGNSNLLGKLTMDFNIDGKSHENGNTRADLDGTIYEIEVNQYKCQKLNIAGKLRDKKFDGLLQLIDKNVALDLSGKFDFNNNKPAFDFLASLHRLNLYGFNIEKEDTASTLSLALDAKFEGNDIDNMVGYVQVDDLMYKRNDSTLTVNSMSLLMSENGAAKGINLKTDFADVLISGTYKFEALTKSISEFLYRYMPTLQKPEVVARRKNVLMAEAVSEFSNISMHVDFKKTDDVLAMFAPGTYIHPDTELFLDYGSNNYLSMGLNSPEMIASGLRFKNINMRSNADGEEFMSNLTVDTVFLTERNHLDHFSVESVLQNDSAQINILWDSGMRKQSYAGNIKTLFRLIPKDLALNPNSKSHYFSEFSFLPSKVVLSDTVWQIRPSHIVLDTTSVRIDSFVVRYNNQYFRAAGGISQRDTDTLSLYFNGINLSNINIVTEPMGLNLQGFMNGYLTVTDLYDSIMFNGDIGIQNMNINGENFGNTSLKSYWNEYGKSVHIEALTGVVGDSNLYVRGDYYPETGQLDFPDIRFNIFPVNVFQPFLDGIVSGLVGRLQGELSAFGTVDKPDLSGYLKLQRIGMKMDYLGTRYFFTNQITIEKDKFIFEPTRFIAPQGDSAVVSGVINHDYFSNIDFDFTINAANFMFLDTKESENEYFYGKAFVTGPLSIKGDADNISIKASVKTEPNTRFFIPLSSTSEVSDVNEFITFIAVDTTETTLDADYNANISGIDLDFDIDVTEDAVLQMIFDQKVGDIIEARGNGNINLKISSEGDLQMMGDYTIAKGEYLFTLMNIINKDFKVKPGGVIRWEGDPYNASVDMNAIYEIRKVAIYDLLLDDMYKDISIPVECNLKMQNSLMNPTITFGITLPDEKNTDDRITQQLTSLPEDEMNKQILSLLIMRRFQPLPGLQSSFEGGQLVSANAYELLSNQLSHWLSQISSDFDLGFEYTPGSDLNTSQIELMLSKQMLNDRISINTNFGVSNVSNIDNIQLQGSDNSNASGIVGDFEIEYKITKNGKLRSKYYAKTNDDRLYYDSYYKQGVGIFYKEEFNSFEELINAYFNKVKKNDKKQKK